MAWEAIKKGVINRTGVVLKRSRGSNVVGYIGAEVRKRLGVKNMGFCNLLQNGSMIMFQFVQKSSEYSRSLKGNTFSLPSSAVDEYWPKGVIGKKEIMPIVDNGNLIIDLKDLAKGEMENLCEK